MSHQDIDNYLEKNGITHRWVAHRPAYTAPETAASAHIRGKDFAKTVVVRLNGKLAMTVMPANEKIVPTRLSKMVGVKDVEIVPETEFMNSFPGCEPGAMPPFGSMFGMPVFVSATLAKDHTIACNAGSHTDCVMLSFADYVKLEHPRVGNFTAIM